MQKKDIITLVTLIILATLTSIISLNLDRLNFAALIILVLSAFKFLVITFQFMELKKAHSFWKILISIYLAFFMIIIYILL